MDTDTDYLQDLKLTVERALSEDVRGGDITAQLIDEETSATAEVITRDNAVICGKPWIDEVFRQVDDSVKLEWLVDEGATAIENQQLLRLTGSARSILTAERTALNFLQTLSGTATRTRHYADLISHTNAQLLDTRKTIPGLRQAQKYAVKAGGGANHRMGLYDAFLIKENHITAAGSIERAIKRARELAPNARLEVEVENLAQFSEAIHASPDWIMLDNFSLKDMQTAVRSINNDIKLEASGGIESDTDLVSIAETGVHFISVGALTKHCQAVDLSMRFL